MTSRIVSGVAGIVMIGSWVCGPAAAAAGIEVSVTRAELEAILVTGAPYRLPLDLFIGTETLSCERPRDLSLENGRIRFRVSCTGSPVPVRGELEPEITVNRKADSGDFEVAFSRLPIKIPGVGTVDIRNYIPPQQVAALLYHAIPGNDRDRIGMIRVHDIRILPDKIEAAFDFRFLPEGQSP